MTPTKWSKGSGYVLAKLQCCKECGCVMIRSPKTVGGIRVNVCDACGTVGMEPATIKRIKARVLCIL
jgi:hypothetical protein